MGSKKYCEDLPVGKEVDVVVVGGGVGGVAAALAAANNGAKTLLIERYGALGGNLTLGLVQSLHGYRSDNDYSDKHSPTADWTNPLMIKNGVPMDIFKRIQDFNGTAFAKDHYGDPSLRDNVDEEIVAYVLDQMMIDTGVEVLFNTFAFDAVMEGNKVIGVVIANKSGPQVINAKVVVDCSGDADIAARAGVEYNKGDEIGRTHGISLQMEIGGIDIDRFLDYLKNRPEPTPEDLEKLMKAKFKFASGGVEIPPAKFDMGGKKKKTKDGQMHMQGKLKTWDEQDQLRKEGKFLTLNPVVDAEWYQYLEDNPYPKTPVLINTLTPEPIYPRSPRFNWYGLVRNGKVRYDQTMSGVHEVFVDHTDEDEVSKALMHCRKINMTYMKFFQERIPGFENAYILKTGTYGGRESRQIVGEYMLTIEDVVNGTQFDDAICHIWRANNLHLLTGQQGFRMWLEPEKPMTVPYRSLVPRKIDNILVGGRPISKHHMVRLQSMPPCMAWGAAAGAAAALSIKANVLPRNVNIDDLQKAIGLKE